MRIFANALQHCVCLVAATITLVGWPSAVEAQETFKVTAGFSELIRLDREPATVAIGNPNVADATLGGGNTLLLTGKTVGLTNIIVLDEAGGEISRGTIRVAPNVGPQITIRHGHAGYRYSCDRKCELVGTIGPQGGSTTGATHQTAAQNATAKPAVEPVSKAPRTPVQKPAEAPASENTDSSKPE